MEEQEISLHDYVKVIIKHKWIVIVVFLICIVPSVLSVLTEPDSYKTSSLIQIGTIYNIKGGGYVCPIKKAEMMEIMLCNKVLQRVIENLDLDITSVELRKMITVEDIKNTDYIKIEVSSKGDTSYTFCNSILNSSLVIAEKLWQERINLVQNWLKEIENQIGTIQSLENETTKVLMQKMKESSNNKETEMLLLKNLSSDYRAQIQSLLRERDNLRLSLANSKAFTVIDPPLMYNAGKEQVRLKIAISAVIGLILAIIAVSIVESWQKSNRGH